MKKILDFILFNIGWVVIVVSAANDLLWPTAIALSLIAINHLYWNKLSRIEEMKFMVIVTIIGSTVDLINPILGFVSFKTLQGSFLFGYPLWMIALWFCFGTLFSHSLQWFKERYALCFLLGAVGGPLSFSAGRQLGALEFHVNPIYPLLINSVEWGILFPLFVWIYFNLVGTASPRSEQEALAI